MDRETKTYKPVPGLASSLRSVNPLTWELKPRHGVKFHNGEPFNAEAVKFTIERILPTFYEGARPCMPCQDGSSRLNADR